MVYNFQIDSLILNPRLTPSLFNKSFGKRELATPIKRYSRKVKLVGPNSSQIPISVGYQAFIQNLTSYFKRGLVVGYSSNKALAQALYFMILELSECPRTAALKSPKW
jgi:hypothetical protein